MITQFGLDGFSQSSEGRQPLTLLGSIHMTYSNENVVELNHLLLQVGS